MQRFSTHLPVRAALCAAVTIAALTAATAAAAPSGSAPPLPRGERQLEGRALIPGHERDPFSARSPLRAPQDSRARGRGGLRLHGDTFDAAGDLPPAATYPYGGNFPGLPPLHGGANHGVACADPMQEQYVAVHAWRRAGGYGPRYDVVVDKISGNDGMIQRTNNYLWHASKRQGGPGLRMRWYCGPVQSVEIPASVPSQPGPVWRYVRDRLWLDRRHKAYVFADFLTPGQEPGWVQGFGGIIDDERWGGMNENNKPDPWGTEGSTIVCEDVRWSARVPCNYGVSFADYESIETDRLGLMHELGHTMGAVTVYAPNEYNGHHCFDGIDVMCYSTNGDIGLPDGTYSDEYCRPEDADTGASPYSFFRYDGSPPVPPFDCTWWGRKSRQDVGHNTTGQPDDFFFAGEPGPTAYLLNHWNTAREYHDWVVRDYVTP